MAANPRTMKVLLCVDGSESSLRAGARAMELAREGAEVTALHAYPPRLDRDVVSQFEIEPDDLDERFGESVLQAVAELFRDNGLTVELTMAEGHLVEVIVGRAKGFDLILVGERPPRGPWQAQLADLIRHRTPVPVEVIS